MGGKPRTMTVSFTSGPVPGSATLSGSSTGESSSASAPPSGVKRAILGTFPCPGGVDARLPLEAGAGSTGFQAREAPVVGLEPRDAAVRIRCPAAQIVLVTIAAIVFDAMEHGRRPIRWRRTAPNHAFPPSLAKDEQNCPTSFVAGPSRTTGTTGGDATGGGGVALHAVVVLHGGWVGH